MHQLEGLRAELEDGTVVGTVREVVHGPGGELLVLARPDAPDALVPFVPRSCRPSTSTAAGSCSTPPEGLLDLLISTEGRPPTRWAPFFASSVSTLVDNAALST